MRIQRHCLCFTFRSNCLCSCGFQSNWFTISNHRIIKYLKSNGRNPKQSKSYVFILVNSEWFHLDVCFVFKNLKPSKRRWTFLLPFFIPKQNAQGGLQILVDKETGDGVDGRAEMQVRFGLPGKDHRGVTGIHSKRDRLKIFNARMISEWPKSWLFAVCMHYTSQVYRDDNEPL